MKNRRMSQLYLAGVFLAGVVAFKAEAQPGLQLVFGNKGVQTIAYGGVILDDVGAYPQDAFHIWHMKSTDLNGNLLSNGGYGWGESNYGESWNAQTNTETYTFSWGSIAAHFVQNGNNLDMTVTETNNQGSGIVFDGAEIYPFALHFPHEPVQFYGYNQFMITTTGPAVSAADFGAGVVTSVIPNEATPLYGGWKSAGNATYWPIMASTSPDGLAAFLPKNDVPVQPGSSFTYTVSLRFTPEGTAADASDAYASFAATYPSRMTWLDRRIIGTGYLASSPSNSDITQPGGFPTNPRRYFNDPSVDITTAAGLQAFQTRMLAQATNEVSTTQAMNGQGVVVWDLEGEQYPQNTTYVCSPDQIGTVAPEMESTITDQHSAYYGSKLVDAYFQTLSKAGLKTGVCVRPQVFTPGPNGTAQQVFLQTNAQIIANLETKVDYANRRWGTTLFYVDSTVDPTGGTLDPVIFQQLITDFPNLLFIPEESTPRYYAYSAPFYTFIFHTDLGTPSSTYKYYPNAFGVNLVNDVSPDTLAFYTPQLTQSVKQGDILMGHADFWQANDPTLVAIYNAAGVKPQATPVINWATPAAVAYGTAVSGTQLNANANVPGSFVYTPAAGTVPSAGTSTLLATFTPADTVNYKSVTALVNLSVAQSAPTIQWAIPASLVYGTALSAAQLNATASAPGTFAYSPGLGTILPAGTSTLNVTFTPANANYSSASASTSVTVTQRPQTAPTVSWGAPASISFGTALSGTQLNATANVPGTFVYSPAAGAVLSAGVSTLSVTFTPADTLNYKSATASSSVTVTQAAPVLRWASPAGAVYGTALSGAQLNASANVPGTFTYVPAAGTVLNAGASTLRVTFTPADGNNYSSASASVSYTVSQAIPVITWGTPASIPYGALLSGRQLNASANVPGAFSYRPGAGTVLPAGNNVLSVAFIPTDSVNYSPVSASTSVYVGQAPRVTPVIAWPQPSGIIYGTALSALQLNATCPVAGSFSYSPSAGVVLKAGIATLAVIFTPSDTGKYSGVITTVSLAVAKATPTLTWAKPAALTAGTALSAAQLNASSNVAGTFTYNPAVGTVLSAGTTTLGTTFTPADAANYNVQSGSVAVTVSAAPANAYLWLISPSDGQAVSGTISVVAGMRLYLDAAGSFLIVDGRYLADRRAWGAPYVYALDTTTLSNGPHTLQVWAHDISNNVTITAPMTIYVAN